MVNINKETYIQRRSALKKTVGNGVLLFLGNGEVGMNYLDNTYHFRQDSSFFYYFGLDYAGLAAVINVDEDEEIVFGDELTIDDIVWTGIQPTLKEKSEVVGIHKTMPLKDLKNYLSKAQAKGQTIHFLPPYRGDHQVWLQELFGLYPAEQASKAQEVACRHGNLSFPIIATVQGQVLHNHGFIHTLKDGDLFLLDAGAETKWHYAGDLSSTMPVGDKFTERQALIYNIHLESFYAAVNALKLGEPFRNAHIAAAAKIVEGMKEIGLMKGNAQDAAESGAYALFFPCGLGHMMGLDVHDMENLGEQYVGYPEGQKKSTQFGFKSLRLARPLEPGFVFTVEPGIYFIPELIDRWKAEKQFTDFINYDKLDDWRGFTGLRNELDYVMTENGPRLLGKIKKPMTIEEVLNAKNSK